MSLRQTAVVGAMLVAGCASSAPTSDGAAGDAGVVPLSATFAVSDYFTPDAYTGDALSFRVLTVRVNDGCKPRPAGARGNCYVYTYVGGGATAASTPQAGVRWVFPGNLDGGTPGRDVDTSKFKQVRFSAAIEGPFPSGNTHPFAAIVGGYSGGGDGAFRTDGLSLGGAYDVGMNIDATMRAFHMPITDDSCATTGPGCDGGVVDSVIAAFGWSLQYPLDGDPSGQTPVKIYLDDIVWDTDSPP